MSTVYATALSFGLAVAAGCGRLVLDARRDPPTVDAIGATVMLVADGKAYGCAKLTGVVTLRGDRYPQLEHPRADELRTSVAAGPGADWAAPVLWVLEGGIGFDKPVEIGGRGDLWEVPARHHEELRAAWRAAKERRTK